MRRPWLAEAQPGPTLTALALHPQPALRLVPAPSTREWMDRSPSRFAYRCLPLLIANQGGWLVLNSEPLRATWDGSDALDGVMIESLEGGPPAGGSHFGCGIVTWTLPYLFRTSPGWDLLVRGPANHPKDGAHALEGVVETDWSPATFTMNWKLTRPRLGVEFGRDEPICMIVPQRRGELEAFQPRLEPIATEPELAASHARWAARRATFLRELPVPGSDAQRMGWQRDYVNGRLPDGTRVSGHLTKRRLRPFDGQ